MTETILQIEQDVKELLSIIHNVKLGSLDKEKLERALLLANRIQAELYQMLR